MALSYNSQRGLVDVKGRDLAGIHDAAVVLNVLVQLSQGFVGLGFVFQLNDRDIAG